MIDLPTTAYLWIITYYCGHDMDGWHALFASAICISLRRGTRSSNQKTLRSWAQAFGIITPSMVITLILGAFTWLLGSRLLARLASCEISLSYNSANVSWSNVPLRRDLTKMNGQPNSIGG